jgi:hypothetical protein
MVASLTDHVARLLRERRRQRGSGAHARDSGVRPGEQRFVAGEDLTPRQTAEIERQNRADVRAPAEGSVPDPQRCPFPSVPLQPGPTAVPRR